MNPGLLLLADGRFPAGGHAYSAGTESAVRYGDVTDAASLERFLVGRLATVGVVDAAFAARTAAACLAAPGTVPDTLPQTPPQTVLQDTCADRARFLPPDPGTEPVAGHRRGSRAIPAAGSGAVLAELDGEYAARVVSARARTVSRRLGRQLLRAVGAVWPDRLPVGDVHQPIALGLAVAAVGAAPHEAAALAYHHLASAVTTAAVRMLGIDPLAAAAVQASALADPPIDPGWATCDPADLPALGSSLGEILAEDHGQWDARLFVA